jgi:hypothetical protein
VVVGRDQHRVAFPPQALGHLFAFLAGRIVGDDPRAVALGGAALGGGGVLRHHDRRPCPEQAAGERRRLGVVARGVREDAARALLGREPGHGVVGAPELEGTRSLQVLALQEQLRPEPHVERARGRDRGEVRDPVEPLRGLLDVLEAHHSGRR